MSLLPALSGTARSAPWAMMTSRQSSRPWDTQRWNLPGERRLDPHTVASPRSLSKEVSDLRGLALRIQFGRTETFFDNESSNFLRFVLLHRLQEPLVTLTPILTLGGGGLKPHITTAKKILIEECREIQAKVRNLSTNLQNRSVPAEQHLYSNTSIKNVTSHFGDRYKNESIFFAISEMSGWRRGYLQLAAAG